MKPINVRQKAIPFVPARYIQTFDVISEVNCLLLRKKWRFEIIVLFCCNTQNRGGKYPSVLSRRLVLLSLISLHFISAYLKVFM